MSRTVAHTEQGLAQEVLLLPSPARRVAVRCGAHNAGEARGAVRSLRSLPGTDGAGLRSPICAHLRETTWGLVGFDFGEITESPFLSQWIFF